MSGSLFHDASGFGLLGDPGSFPSRWLREVLAHPTLREDAHLLAVALASQMDEHGSPMEFGDDELDELANAHATLHMLEAFKARERS